MFRILFFFFSFKVAYFHFLIPVSSIPTIPEEYAAWEFVTMNFLFNTSLPNFVAGRNSCLSKRVKSFFFLLLSNTSKSLKSRGKVIFFFYFLLLSLVCMCVCVRFIDFTFEDGFIGILTFFFLLNYLLLHLFRFYENLIGRTWVCWTIFPTDSKVLHGLLLHHNQMNKLM